MPRAAPIESVRLLIIEDDPVDVELIRALLGKSERLKALVAHADRLSVGLGLLEKGGVDLLLLDLGLPDSYGLETFNELHGRFTNVPVIILSGLDDEDTATLAVSKGAQDYLVKGSINTDVLVRSIRYAIQRHEINMIASRNIAQRERAEEALIQLNRELEQRVETEVADRMQKERLLLHQSRMAAMGEVVNAVAHQWRQPLSVISLTAQDIKDAYRHGELDADYIKNAIGGIIDQVGFMSATIDDFRNFLKPAGAVTMFDVKEAIENIISMFSLIFKKNDIAISFNIMDKDGGAAPCVNGGAAPCVNGGAAPCVNGGAAPCVNGGAAVAFNRGNYTAEGYPNEFKHVILNLLNNSKDAILSRPKAKRRADGFMGGIDMEISRRGGAAPCVNGGAAASSNYDGICVTISDDGGGMPEDIIDKIFEPYFTTKGEDKGTGIGLYMCKTIIEKNMGGSISAANVPGGARFEIVLPCAKREDTA